MEYRISSQRVFPVNKRKEGCASEVTTLAEAQINKGYFIKDIKTEDEELKKFLFTLGCYQGEMVTIMSILGENYIISVKDTRYSIDRDLAEAIII